MNAPPANTLQNAPQGSRERFSRLAVEIIIFAGLAAYANSLSDAFVFDDINSIVMDPAVRHLWPLWKFFVPLNRPVLNLSLAVNYVLWGSSVLSPSGLNVVSYRMFNIAVHILAALTLFGLVRRTLTLPALRARFEGVSTALALATALIWEVHPLQTESVTYIIQRAESLAGLFYLLTLYCLTRGAHSDRPLRWCVAAVAACALGLGTKQTVATAPLVALLYDRTFLSGSFREALRRRWALYVALAATWLLLIPSVASSVDARRVSAGFQLPGIAPMGYAVTQLGVILHYLRLSFWPAGLCLDYDWPAAKDLAHILPGAVVIGALIAATAALALQPATRSAGKPTTRMAGKPTTRMAGKPTTRMAGKPAWGFLGAWFFLILAPTSSFIPIADSAVEHRMYLPLAAVAAFVVIGGYVLLGRLARHSCGGLARRGGIGGDRRSARPWPAAAVCLIVAVLGCLTALRNLDYRSELSIWDDTVRKAPDNPRAFAGRGKAYSDLHDYARSLRDHDEAIRLNPNYTPAYNSRAIVYNELLQLDKALADCNVAIAQDPNFAIFHNTRAVVLACMGRYEQAIQDYDKAIELSPGLASAYMNRGVAYGKSGRLDKALADFDKALALMPDYPSAYYNRGNTYFDRDDYDRAISDYTRAIALRHNYTDAYCNRASAYFWKKDYRRAWADVQALRNLGVEPPPQLIQQLTQAAPPE